MGSWRDPALSTASHAGMVNNMNDGLAWGLFPLFFAAAGMSISQIGLLSFIYPAVWGALRQSSFIISHSDGVILGTAMITGSLDYRCNPYDYTGNPKSQDIC